MLITQIYLDISTDFFKEFKIPDYKYIFVFFIALFIFSRIPNLSFTSENQKVKEWIASFFNSRKKQEKRINNLLIKLIKIHNIKKLVFGNFDINQNSLINNYLFDNEVQNILFIAREVNFDSLRKEINNLNNNISFSTKIKINNQNSNLLFYLSSEEKKIISILMLSLDNKTYEISIELASLFFNHYNKDSKKIFSSIIEIFQSEYNLLYCKDERVYLNNFIYKELEEINKENLKYYKQLYKNFIVENPTKIKKELVTTYSLYQLYKYTQNNDILKQLILKSFNKEDYHIFDSYNISKIYDIPSGNTIIDKFNNKESIYLSFNIEILEKILIILERLGQIEKARILCIYLQGSQDEFYKVVEARLEHREGNFKKSLIILASINISSLKDQKLMEYYRIYAWIIQDYKNLLQKKLGYEYLAKLLALAKEQNDMWYIRSYYNTIGNYYEWEKDYNHAIDSYQNALAIPGLGSYSYGALFTNLGVCYKCQYQNQNKKNHITIENSIKFLKKGIYLKKDSSAHDEIQISYHNLAISMLLKAKYTLDNNFYIKALEYIELGLNVVKKYNMKLKKDLLLLEKYIVFSKLNKNEKKEVLGELKEYLELENYELDSLNELSKEFFDKDIKELINE